MSWCSSTQGGRAAAAPPAMGGAESSACCCLGLQSRGRSRYAWSMHMVGRSPQKEPNRAEEEKGGGTLAFRKRRPRRRTRQKWQLRARPAHAGCHEATQLRF